MKRFFAALCLCSLFVPATFAQDTKLLERRPQRGRRITGQLMKRFFAALCLCSLFVPATFAQDTKLLPPIRPVEKVDLNRYIGKWYEIALLPNRFQAQCLTDTAAEYALQPDGKIQVTNRCRNADGKVEMVIGAAKNARYGAIIG
jgi:lipocalin